MRAARRSAFLFAILIWPSLSFTGLAANGLGVALHRQRDLVLLQVDFEHADGDAVAGADHFARVFDKTVTEPRNVDQSVLMHADVNDRAEISHVGDDARTGHSRSQVFDFVNVFAVSES